MLRSAVDVAEQLLQVSPRTLEDWRLTRSGPLFRKMGRHVRYELGSVMAWFENLGR
ncbi:helix-turn-helix domain-containing protein [Rathayibacter iranicus]|uniref:Helix-turn-helix domain-containing protein n=2 Tax=Rathayibacter iranicus TaxID=59737 RepID=A0AAD1ELU7_9MICO|nr:helix-turn-helix domain-containing protein [Rathayibacter iranicus]PPI48226.1 excisionase [Rathayibacter iranicus]PPI60857.1 excisionase [Rathayibacter iranicus]PPI72615.1 excisionase [Rathayibacter iranicus]PWJ63321.1 helix-turn-helix protein [Rathayibacter iranicus] [Rathayibacter iranicus NCPPB 2253 = VKM Ac-1602]